MNKTKKFDLVPDCLVAGGT